MKAESVSRFVRMCGVIFVLGAAVAQAGGGATITLQPVQPTTIPFSTYPPGTTIVGQEIIIGSLPARVWLEVHITGWAPETLLVVQATIAAITGVSGENAMCTGEPAVDAGDLDFATVSCPSANATGNSVCTAALSGVCSPSPTRCVAWNGVNPPWHPAGYYCEPAFYNACHPRWPATPITAVVDLGITNFRYGFAVDPGGPYPLDFMPSYIGTLVLDIPATAKGTYTIGFNEEQTFMQNDGLPGDNNIPIQLIPARITIPCGRCCHGVGGGNLQCVETMSIHECAGLPDSVFTADEVCPDAGGPACAECVTDMHCDDGQFCNGAEVCNPNDNECRPGTVPCREWENCEEQQQRCAERIPTVSNWGMVVMVLALAVAAKLRYRTRCA